MIDIQERLATLQQEREGLLQRLQQLTAERERIAHLVSAYDGALGELTRLLQLSFAHEEPNSAEDSPAVAN